MKRFFPLLLLVVLPLFLTDCKPEDDEGNPQDPFDTFDRKDMLRDMAQGLRVGYLTDFVNRSETLQSSAAAFAQSQDEAKLNQMRLDWTLTTDRWKNMEYWQVGPMEDMTQLERLAEIDNGTAYPDQIERNGDSTAIENAIAGTTPLTKAYVESLPTNAQGLWAIEYLLWTPGQDATQIVNAFKANSRRAQYLNIICQLVHDKAELIWNAWDGYEEEFVNNDGRDIGSSLGMLANELVFMVEVIKNEKLGRPLGKRTAGNLQPRAVEAYRSQKSLQFMKENIIGLKQTFNGGTATGIDDLLNHLDAKFQDEQLSVVINRQFNVLYEAVNKISDPLSQSVQSNPALVETAYNEAKKLTVLLKVDMFNNLGTVITYTDNDGD